MSQIKTTFANALGRSKIDVFLWVKTIILWFYYVEKIKFET